MAASISTNGLILGQLKTSEKSNEITAIPELLDMLFVKDCIITILSKKENKKKQEDGRRDLDAVWGKKEYKGVRKDGTAWSKV